MNTIDSILALLNAKGEELKATIGTGELSSAQNTFATDELAAILETVNPNHDYPPTPR